MKHIASITETERLLADYQHHLLNHAGSTPSTCRVRIFYARRFLNAQFKPREKLDLKTLTPQALLQYVLGQRQRMCLETLQSAASCLRSFCRFLFLSGRTQNDLCPAIPRVGSNGRDELPTYLSSREVELLLRHVAGHQRDYAIVLCLAKLGLRVGEVAHLTLDDVNWRAGTLRLVQTKGRRERELPLPPEVGKAMAEYLRHGRSPSTSRRIFLSLRDAHPIRATGITALTTRAMSRVGIESPRKGPHLLRHTVASHLVQRGTTLKAVADLLGHRSLSTTQVYAKVNEPLLKQVAVPWPKEARV